MGLPHNAGDRAERYWQWMPNTRDSTGVRAAPSKHTKNESQCLKIQTSVPKTRQEQSTERHAYRTRPAPGRRDKQGSGGIGLRKSERGLRREVVIRQCLYPSAGQLSEALDQLRTVGDGSLPQVGGTSPAARAARRPCTAALRATAEGPLAARGARMTSGMSCRRGPTDLSSSWS